MSERPKVLIVDDKKENLFALQKSLENLDITIHQATSGNEALGLTLDHDYCLAIVDVQMPDMDGYELVELLRGSEATSTLPVIFVSAIYSDEYHHRKGYDSGAVDFMSKPFVPEILISKVRIFIDLYEKRRNLQDLINDMQRANSDLSRHAVHMEVSNQVGQQVTSILDLQELLPAVANLIQQNFRYSMVNIWLVNDARDMLILQATTYPRLQPGVTTIPIRHPGLVARSANLGETFVENKACLNASYVPTKGLSNICSELAIPLISQREALGVLDIQSERLQAFATDDVAAIRIIADQVSVAIRNAVLYSQIVRFNEELESMVAQRTVELRKAYNTLEKLDKTKSDFVRVAAHELRTPLSVIRGYAGMLNEKVKGSPDAEMLVQGIITGEDRLLEIVNSILDISRIDTASLNAYKEPVRIADVFASIQEALGDDMRDRKLEFQMMEIDQLPTILGDIDLLRKLFSHLVRNAMKFTPDGGQITVTGKFLPATPDYPDAAIQVTVKDTGIGIDPEDLEVIFEKFYRTGPVQLHSSGKTKFKGGGPGLGLSIARGIALAHNGKVWAESTGCDEDKLPGSSFYVILRVGNVAPSAEANQETA